VFCACEIIWLFPTMFYVVSPVHKCNFRFVINVKKTTSFSDFDGICTFAPIIAASIKGLYRAVQVNSISLIVIKR